MNPTIRGQVTDKWQLLVTAIKLWKYTCRSANEDLCDFIKFSEAIKSIKSSMIAAIRRRMWVPSASDCAPTLNINFYSILGW